MKEKTSQRDKWAFYIFISFVVVKNDINIKKKKTNKQ